MPKQRLACILSIICLWACSPYTPQTRRYFIAAEEVEWDYAPLGLDGVSGAAFTPEQEVFVKNGPNRIGHKYRKVIYREYTDSSFTRLAARPAAWQHLGLLGPVLRGVEGDTIEVVFLNHKDNTHNYSMHPHGVLYDKNSEGAPYADGHTSLGDSVPPGKTAVYEWKVTEQSIPGHNEGSSILWMYHSHVDEPKDSNTGLVGPIIITRAMDANADGTPQDVDRELVLMLQVMDENKSWLLDKNIATYPTAPAQVNKEDSGFIESNLMHSVNGYVFGNTPHLTVHKGERVRWYTFAMGTEIDLHTPHWHGQTLMVNHMRTDVTELLPGSMRVGDMVPQNTGRWLFHCHVNDHIDAGMTALFDVMP